MKHLLRPLPLAAATFLAALAIHADTYTWANPAGGTFEEPANWLVGASFQEEGATIHVTGGTIPATCPGSSDSILFCAGTYTITLAEDHVVTDIDLSTGTSEIREWAGHSVFYPTIDLGTHTLTASRRIDVSLRTPQYYNDNPEEFGSLTFVNGTLVCNGNLQQCGDEDANNINATGFGAGVCWGQNWYDRVRGHLVIGNGATATASTAFVMGYNSGIQVAAGGALTVSGWMQAHHRAIEHLKVSGTGATATIDTFNISGQTKTNIVENGASASIGQVRWGYWLGADGNVLIVRSGATLALSRGGDEAWAEQTDSIHDSLVLVTGEGSTLSLPESSWFQFGNKRDNVGEVLRVADGGAVRGPDSAKIVIGRGPGCTGNMLDVDNGTVVVGHINFGAFWQVWDFSPDGPFYGYASNGVLRVAGEAPLVHATSQSWAGGGEYLYEGTINLNFGTTLQFDLPAAGWTNAPVQIDTRLWSRASDIPGYEDAPSCYLVVNAADFARAHPGQRVVLVQTAMDSTPAFTTLIANASFPDTAGTAFLGTVEIASEGKQLVYTAPKSNTTVVLLR